MASDGVDGLGTVGKQCSPTRVRGLNAESEEREEGFIKDDGRDGEGEVNHDHSEEVGQEVAEEDANVGLSERACGGDEGGFPEGEDLTANDARHGEPFDEAEREDEDEDAAVGEEVSSGSRSEVTLEERVEDEGGEDDEDEARDGVEDFQ